MYLQMPYFPHFKYMRYAHAKIGGWEIFVKFFKSEHRFIVPSQRGTKSLSQTFTLNVPSWCTVKNIINKMLEGHLLKSNIYLLLGLS